MMNEDLMRTMSIKSLNEYSALYNIAIEFNNERGRVVPFEFPRGSRTLGWIQ